MASSGGATRTRPRGDRRSDLLAAAARRFVADGVARTTMEDIARDAGAGKATLYRHFRNKDAVVDALLEREARRLGDEVDAASRAAHGAEALVAAVATSLEFLLDHPMLTRGRDREPAILLARVTATDGPLVREVLARFADLIGAGVRAGELRDVPTRPAAEVLLRVVLSYFALPPVAVDLSTTALRRAFARDLVTAGLAVRRD